MKTYTKYAALALAALLVLSFVLCGGPALSVHAEAVSVTVTSDLYQRPDGLNRYHKTQTYIGVVEGSSRFEPADLVDLGVNAYRIYMGVARMEPVDDDGVYGSPTPAEIKADPNVVPWSVWDDNLVNLNTYWWVDPSNPHITLKQILDGLRANGVEPIMCVRLKDSKDEPDWFPSGLSTPEDHNEWWQFVHAMAYLLNVRNDYQITYWEMLNEPNGRDYSGSMDDYAEVIDDAYDAIHHVNDALGLPVYIMAPNNGDHDEQWIDGILQRRDAKVDVVNYHEYAPDQDAYSRGYWDRVFDNDTDGVIEPLWNGEWGSALGGYDSVSDGLKTALQLIEQCQSDLFGGTLYEMYTWTGCNKKCPPLVEPDGTRVAGYYGIRLAIRGLQGGKTMVQAETADTSRTYVATKDGDNLYLLIHNDSGEATVSADVSAHVTSGTATIYEYSAANMDVVVATPALSAGQFSFSAPGSSLTLAVIPLSGGGPTNTPAPPTDTPVPTATPTEGPSPTPSDTPEPATDTPTPAGGTNLALNQPTEVSSYENSSFVGAMAVDGDLATRWRSKKRSSLPSEWIQVDLGGSFAVGQVTLRWDDHYATSYTIQLSENGSDWSTVYSTTSGDGLDDEITFAATSARYVKMDSTAWENNDERCWLNEFEVYGEGGPAPTDTPEPPTDTPEPPTDTPEPPTDTPEPPTDTPVPPTDTPEPGPTDTPEPPTDTPLPPTDTPVPPTDTPIPPTDTPAPTATPGGSTVMHVEAVWSCDVDGNPKDVFSKSVDDFYYWRVKIQDGDEQPVVGASVTSSAYRPGDYPTEPWKTYTASTDATGVAALSRLVKNNDLVGIYTLDVDDIVKSGMTYDPNADAQDTDTFEVVD